MPFKGCVLCVILLILVSYQECAEPSKDVSEDQNIPEMCQSENVLRKGAECMYLLYKHEPNIHSKDWLNSTCQDVKMMTACFKATSVQCEGKAVRYYEDVIGVHQDVCDVALSPAITIIWTGFSRHGAKFASCRRVAEFAEKVFKQEISLDEMTESSTKLTEHLFRCLAKVLRQLISDQGWYTKQSLLLHDIQAKLEHIQTVATSTEQFTAQTLGVSEDVLARIWQELEDVTMTYMIKLYAVLDQQFFAKKNMFGQRAY